MRTSKPTSTDGRRQRPIVATSVEAAGLEVMKGLPQANVQADPLEAHLPQLQTAHVLCVGVHDRVTRDILDRAPLLELVVTRSTGLDNVDVEACAAADVRATALPEYATWAVAEHTLAGLILLLRQAPVGHDRARAGLWDRTGLDGRRLRDATVAVVGVGRIGKALSTLLSRHGARIHGHDIAPTAGFSPPGFSWAATLDEALAGAHAVTLHVPLTPDTRHLLDRRRLESLQPGALVANTSRGPVVDTAALVELLRSGHLGGALVDVLEGEPRPPLLAQLASLPNVLVTPHLAAYDRVSQRARYELAAQIILSHLEAPRPRKP